jgi:hypothetical protein
MYGLKVDSLDMTQQQISNLAFSELQLLSPPSDDIRTVKVVIVTGRAGASADTDPVIRQHKASRTDMPKSLKPSCAALTTTVGTPMAACGTRSLRSTMTNLPLIQKPLDQARATHIICTMGPACSSEEGIRQLLDAGCDVIRLDFAHGDHAGAPPTLRVVAKIGDKPNIPHGAIVTCNSVCLTPYAGLKMHSVWVQLDQAHEVVTRPQQCQA